jgi:hypothetical protein
MDPVPADTGGTAQTVHDTAEALERAAATLHRSAAASPDTATAQRLAGLRVTVEAKAIDRRADELSLRTAATSR